MTREEMWKEFENQLIRETRTPVTMSFDDAEKLTKLGIEETVAKWKRRLEQTRWIPVSERLPELNKPLLVTAYHRVCYAHMISKNGNYGYPVFRLHEIKDSSRGWVQETISHEPYSMGRIDAWMYIDIPQPYKGESEKNKDDK